MIKRSQTKPFLTGTGGIGAFEHISSLLTQSILKESGVEFKQDFVHYRGTSDIILAIQKGEVEGSLMSASNTINPVRNGDLKVLAVYSAERDDVFARGVPSLIEQKVPGAEKMLAAIRQDRTLVGPPGMPQDVAEVLQKALWKALNDKQFIEDARKANLPVNISEAATAAQYASDALKIAKENEQMLKGAMEF